MRGLRYVIVVQLALAAVGLFVVEPEGDGTPVATAPSTTTTTTTTSSTASTTSPSTTKPSLAAAVTTTTAASGRSTTTARNTTTTARAAGQALTPTKAGTYEYRMRITADGETSESTGSYTYEAVRETEGERRQTVRDVEDGTTTTTSFAWRSDGLYLRAIDEGEEEGCNIEPDFMLVPSPLNVGKRWSIDSGCAGDDPGRLQATSRVLRTERITVAGRSVQVHVIETQSEEFRSLQYFSLAHGLMVREQTDYGGESDEVMELLNLDPK